MACICERKREWSEGDGNGKGKEGGWNAERRKEE